MNAIIVGSAACLFNDFIRARQVLDSFNVKYEIICLNLAMMAFSQAHINQEIKVTHWMGLHHYWFYLRDHLAPGVATHCTRPGPGIDYVHANVVNTVGSAGLWSIRLCLHYKWYERIILCGIPIDDQPRFYDAPWIKQIYSCTSVRYCWDEVIAHNLIDKDRIRSMSGWTKEQFGQPEKDWLVGDVKLNAVRR